MKYFHLIYRSLATKILTKEDLKDILKTSNRENLKNAITGFLTFRDNYFLQLLEGSENQVMETLDRIKKDTRHFNLVVIGEYYSDTLIVPDWRMALVDTDKMASSTESLIDLFDLARGKNLFDSRKSLELVLKKFSKDAKPFVEI